MSRASKKFLLDRALVVGSPNPPYLIPYLIFVTGATGGARVIFFSAGVNFYRFNAKNWHF